MQLRTRPWQRSLTVAQKRSRRDRRTFLDALEFASVLDFLDGRSLFFYGCTQRSACSVSEAFCRAVVQRRGWICGVGQSARQRLSRGGVFIDGITAYHDASQQPFNYRSWFDRCTTHSTLRIDEHNRFEVRAAALEGYELHVGVATGDYDSMSHPSVSEHCWLLDLREGAFVHRGAFRRDDMWSSSTDESFRTGDTVGLALARDGSCAFYRNGRRLASRGSGGWGPRLQRRRRRAGDLHQRGRRRRGPRRSRRRTACARPSPRRRRGAAAPRDLGLAAPSGDRSARVGALCGAVVFLLYFERVLRVATRTAWVPLELSAFGDGLLYSVAWSAAWQDHCLKHTDGVLRRSRRGLRTCVRLHCGKCVAVALGCALVASAATRPFAGDLTVAGFLDQRTALAYVAAGAGAVAVAHFFAIAARVGDGRARSVNLGVVLIFASFFLHNWCAHDGWVLAFLAPAPRGGGGGACADYLGDDGLSQAMHMAELFQSLGARTFESRDRRDASRADALAYPLWAVWLALEVVWDVEVFRHVVIDDRTVLWRAALPVGRPAALPLAPPAGPAAGDDRAAARARDVESQRMFAASVLLPLTILHCFHLDVARVASGDGGWRAAALPDFGGGGARDAGGDAAWHVVLGLLKRFRDLLRVSLDDDTAADALAPDAAYPYACHYYPFAQGSRADRAFVLLTYACVVAWLYGGWWLGFARPHRAAWLGRAHTWPFHCDHAGLDLACLGS
ncbi:hypothetical protein JL721_2068 [Aureococcus anophagefferens]|nr:hypothetical protein JL721_2068 [Aureococcus anophagefferens]